MTRTRRFKVIGNRIYGHVFKVGQIVELIQIYPDGVYEVEAKWYNKIITQDVSPRDLEEIERNNEQEESE